MALLYFLKIWCSLPVLYHGFHSAMLRCWHNVPYKVFK